MITHQGNVLANVHDGIIMHQVNCQGVMGSGIAKEIRELYPAVWTKFTKKSHEHLPSELLGQVQLVRVTDTLWIANLFAQENYGRDGKRYTSYDALDTCFKTLADLAVAHQFASSDIHHPLIGAGLGGGSWEVIEALIEHRLGPYTNLWLLQ